MDSRRVLVAALVVGVVVNLFDFLVHGMLLGPAYAALPDVMRQDAPVAWLVVLEFLMALVFVWVYARVRGSFAAGAGGGAAFGFYAGVLLGFPAQLFATLMFEGFPYWLSWAWVLGAIGWGLVAGATAGAVYGRDAPAG